MRILVTGAASGVGRATAALLQVRGHDVIASARNRSALDDLEAVSYTHLDVYKRQDLGCRAEQAREL